MANEAQEQGQKLQRIDDIIIDTKDTVHKAENEIKIAEEGTRKNTKKICCLIWMILFVVAAIILVLWFSLH